MHHPTDRITHTTAFVTPVVEHWLEREPSGKKKHSNLILKYLQNVFVLNACVSAFEILVITCVKEKKKEKKKKKKRRRVIVILMISIHFPTV